MTTINVTFKIRRDTTTNWATYNPTLAEGEIGIDTDLNKFKIGKKVDGVLQTWSQLQFANLLASDLTTAISDHNAQTTNVHGIANTANLATQTYVNSAVSSLANTAVETYVPISDVGNADGVAPLDANTQISTTYLANVTKAFVGLGNVDNTSDTNKPISTATQSALDLKAPLASPTLTGTPTAPTATSSTNTTQIATTAFVKTALDNLINAAPGTLDTLGEIATQLAADEGVVSALTSTVATKAPINNPTFTGTVSGITKAMVGLGNVDNTSDANKPIPAAVVTSLNNLDARIVSLELGLGI